MVVGGYLMAFNFEGCLLGIYSYQGETNNRLQITYNELQKMIHSDVSVIWKVH